MEIQKVERQRSKGINQLEVTYIDNGKTKVMGFASTEDALSICPDGEKKFIKVLKSEKNKEIKISNEDKNKIQKDELKEYENKSI